MLIGELSARTGVSPRSLRHYEKLGLLTSHRESNGYRRYGERAVDLVGTIRVMFDLKLPASLVREVLPCASGATEALDRAALLRTVSDVRQRLGAEIDQLTRTYTALDGFLASAAPDDPGLLDDMAALQESSR